MSDLIYFILCGALAVLVLIGIAMMSKVKTALWGNLLSALASVLAILLTMQHYSLWGEIALYVCAVLGLAAGFAWAAKVKMIDMPQTVALLNGLGGAASALIALATLLNGTALDAFSALTGVLALAIGMITLIGSLIAAGKLARILKQKPVTLKGHGAILLACLVLTLACVVLAAFFPQGSPLVWLSFVCLVASAALGLVFVIRVGGADMPITISLLNSLSGVAGGIAGMAVGEPLLVAVGGIVGASGLILTEVMCHSMNRRLLTVLTGKTSVDPAAAVEAQKAVQPEEAEAVTAEAVKEPTDPAAGVIEALQNAKTVILVPGYGMALSQAQYKLKELADRLTARGVQLRYAIHPVAGRMPGHMNVLLCEVDVDYDQLYEMDVINGDFKDTDVTIVVGANDVMNPAANTAEGTPIYGMPVLRVDDCPNVIICNFDLKPGYAGVPNPLYSRDHGVLLLIGDAKDSLDKLLSELN